MNYDFESIGIEKLALSMTDGIADDKYFLWVPDWLEDAEEKEYLVLLNTGDRIDKNYEIVYKFKSEYVRNKCCYAISNDGKTALIGYVAKKGVICIDCESGQVLWNNPKVKKIDGMRFNNFNSDVIEVINTKLEITYLDKNTGKPLDEEKRKKVRQVVNEMHSSKNGRYLITCDTFSSKDKANYTVYDTETREITGSFVAPSKVASSAFDITNDGKYAICSAYQKEGISLIKVATGAVIWNQKITKMISHAYFDKDDKKVVVTCNYNGVYFLNVENGELDQHKNCEKFCLNKYGKDIKFLDRNVVRIGNRQIDSPTFTFTDVIGLPNGVALVPAGEEYGVRMYDNNGQFLWENKDVHIENLVYQEAENTICGYCNTYGISKIAIIDAENGQLISKLDEDDFACAFIDNNTKLICNTGKMYDVSNRGIVETEDIFKLLV